MFAYDPTEWRELFVASAGAGAALAGLVFVAVSINLERILQFKGLPERALETVLLLLSVVLVSIICLIPGQGHTALGVELLFEGAVFAIAIALLSRRNLPAGQEPGLWLTGRLLLRVLGTMPFVIGGLSLLVADGAGLYWIAIGIVAAIAGAVANAWVLLVESLR